MATKNPSSVSKLAHSKWIKAYAVRIRRSGGRRVIDIAQGRNDGRVENPSAVASLASGRWVKCKAVRIRRVGTRKEVDVRQ